MKNVWGILLFLLLVIGVIYLLAKPPEVKAEELAPIIEPEAPIEPLVTAGIPPKTLEPPSLADITGLHPRRIRIIRRA